MDISIGLLAFLLISGGTPSPAMLPDQAVINSEKIAQATTASVEPSAPDAPSLTVKLTAYNAVPEQTDGNPFVTAAGIFSNPEVIAARSHDLAGDLPFGTVIAIERPSIQSASKCHFDSVSHLIGYRIIGDTTHSRKREQIDLLFNRTDTVSFRGREINPSVALGVCDGVVIRVVGRLAMNEIPKTQAELVQMVEGTRLALAK